MIYTDITIDHEYGSANTVKRIYDKATEKLKEATASWR